MLVIPAIDLSEGQVVRLRRGEMSAKTVYSDDPVAVARQWCEQGAQIVHIVDLDAAVTGGASNLAVLAEIRQAVPARLQFGGGLRTLEAIEAALEAGADWVVLGTIALVDPDLLQAALARHTAHIVVALDARDGLVAVEGWTKTTSMPAPDLARRMQQLGVQRLLCTDISTDGTLSGPNIAGLQEIARAVDVPILASGGVSSLDDIIALRQLEPLGIIGVITGRALYDGRLDLRKAIAAAEA